MSKVIEPGKVNVFMNFDIARKAGFELDVEKAGLPISISITANHETNHPEKESKTAKITENALEKLREAAAKVKVENVIVVETSTRLAAAGNRYEGMDAFVNRALTAVPAIKMP